MSTVWRQQTPWKHLKSEAHFSSNRNFCAKNEQLTSSSLESVSPCNDAPMRLSCEKQSESLHFRRLSPRKGNARENDEYPRALKMRKSVFRRKLLMRLVLTRARDLRARWCVSSRLVSCKSNLAGNRVQIQSEVKWNAWQVSLKFLHTASAKTSDWTHHPPISQNFFRNLHAYLNQKILR